MKWGTPMIGNVTALKGVAGDREIQGQKHAAHTLQACGLGSSHTIKHAWHSLQAYETLGTLGIQPHVTSHRSSYLGLYPQRGPRADR